MRYFWKIIYFQMEQPLISFSWFNSTVETEYRVTCLGAVHEWRLLNSQDFGPPPTPLSVPNSRNLPSFGQNLANPLPPPQGTRHMCMPPFFYHSVVTTILSTILDEWEHLNSRSACPLIGSHIWGLFYQEPNHVIHFNSKNRLLMIA